MEKLCECGCGKPTKVIKYTDRANRVTSGERRRFITGHNRRGKFGDAIALRAAKHAQRVSEGLSGITKIPGASRRYYAYRITPVEYECALKAQDYKCAACRRPFGSTKRTAPNVDHDHSCCEKQPTCGECTRGIICGCCNWVLGLLEEDRCFLPQYLIDYLFKYEKKETGAVR